MMARHSASSVYFLERYLDVAKRMGGALRDYLGDPSEKNTHDLRSSIRRLDACMELLPKKARKAKGIRRYRERYRKVLKRTSPIRDVDLLLARLGTVRDGDALSLLARRAATRRRKLIDDSMRTSWKLFELPVPKFGRGDLAGLNRRIYDVVVKLDGEIAALLPKVSASESNLEELHKLRIRSKRLRYVIEAIPPSASRTSAHELLRSWQDLLGSVHDSDAMIETLKDASPSSEAIRRLLRAEREQRHARYADFQRAYTSVFGDGAHASDKEGKNNNKKNKGTTNATAASSVSVMRRLSSERGSSRSFAGHRDDPRADDR